ncbi:MAG: hypothetical protein AAF203_10525, partial [Pseudomonadota bacterium]
AHFNSTNIQNKIVTRNLGLDAMIGMTLNDFSFFLGGGWANSAGTFTGGSSGITASQRQESAKVDSSHFMFGGTYNFDPIFVGVSIDRYQDEVYSIKSGILF